MNHTCSIDSLLPDYFPHAKRIFSRGELTCKDPSLTYVIIISIAIHCANLMASGPLLGYCNTTDFCINVFVCRKPYHSYQHCHKRELIHIQLRDFFILQHRSICKNVIRRLCVLRNMYYCRIFGKRGVTRYNFESQKIQGGGNLVIAPVLMSIYSSVCAVVWMVFQRKCMLFSRLEFSHTTPRRPHMMCVSECVVHLEAG